MHDETGKNPYIIYIFRFIFPIKLRWAAIWSTDATVGSIFIEADFDSRIRF